MDRRGARAEEFVAALRAIWTQDVVDVHGEFHSMHGIRVEPRPMQRPHPPVLLGGTVPAALRRAGRIADGWISGSGEDLTNIGSAIAVVRSGAEGTGRDPAALRFICRGVVQVRREGRAGGSRRPLRGSYADIRADLATLAAAGVTETFLDLNFDPQVGSVDADPDASTARALEVLEELAP